MQISEIEYIIYQEHIEATDEQIKVLFNHGRMITNMYEALQDFLSTIED